MSLLHLEIFKFRNAHLYQCIAKQLQNTVIPSMKIPGVPSKQHEIAGK